MQLAVEVWQLEVWSLQRSKSRAAIRGRFAEIAAVLRRRGFEPVWKDWDQALMSVCRFRL